MEDIYGKSLARVMSLGLVDQVRVVQGKAVDRMMVESRPHRLYCGMEALGLGASLYLR